MGHIDDVANEVAQGSMELSDALGVLNAVGTSTRDALNALAEYDLAAKRAVGRARAATNEGAMTRRWLTRHKHLHGEVEDILGLLGSALEKASALVLLNQTLATSLSLDAATIRKAGRGEQD